MSTVIEYTLRPRRGEYDALLAQYIQLADDVAEHDLSVRMLLVAGDAEQRLIRGIGIYGTPVEAEVGVIAAFHRNVRERLEDDVERASLELIHLHSRGAVHA